MEYTLGNIRVRPMTGPGVNPGWVMKGHTHNFDHISIFFIGRWRAKRWKPALNSDGVQLRMADGELAWVELEDIVREAPFWLLIEKDCRHRFEFIGCIPPDWMKKYTDALGPKLADEFVADYAKTQGQGWCVYSLRNAQGDVVEHYTGWEDAFV